MPLDLRELTADPPGVFTPFVCRVCHRTEGWRPTGWGAAAGWKMLRLPVTGFVLACPACLPVPREKRTRPGRPKGTPEDTPPP